jgi:hypothetical protein
MALRTRIDSDTKTPENYGFVRMTSVKHAHAVAQLLETEHPKAAKVTVIPATNPEDIVNRTLSTFGVTCSLISFQIWENLNKSPTQIIIRKTTGWALFVILAIFSLPLFFGISFLYNMSSVRIISSFPTRFPSYCKPEDFQSYPSPR